MKICLRLFTLIAAFATMISCESMNTPDESDTQGGDSVLKPEGDVSVVQGKRFARISMQRENNAAVLTGTDVHEWSEEATFEYDSDMRLTESVWNFVNGDYREQNVQTYDYGTKGELRLVWKNISDAGSADEDVSFQYHRYILDDKGRAVSLWVNKGTSAFQNMDDFTKSCEISYVADGRLSRISYNDGVETLFRYTDGMMTSTEVTMDGQTRPWLSFPLENYANRYPAKGDMANLIVATTLEGSNQLMPAVLAGHLGKTSDYLLEKGLFGYPARELLPDIYEDEPNVRYHVSEKKTRFLAEDEIFEYTFDADGYVIGMKRKEAFDIMQVDYDVVGSSRPDENGCYKCSTENYSETKIDSGFNCFTYEIEYL